MDDSISRQAAIAVADSTDYVGLSVEDIKKVTDEVVKGLKQLPSVQPEIIRCRDCIKQDLCAWYRDGAKYCSFAERRTDGVDS